MRLFAQNDNERINQWLAQHPGVLGAGALVLGLVLLALGASALLTGRAKAKRGPDLTGANARMMGIVWLVFGSLCSLFGLYKIVSGLF
jgi:hypothetical protein